MLKLIIISLNKLELNESFFLQRVIFFSLNIIYHETSKPSEQIDKLLLSTIFIFFKQSQELLLSLELISSRSKLLTFFTILCNFQSLGNSKLC